MAVRRSLAAGCGRGLGDKQQALLADVLARAGKAVLDADALTLLAGSSLPLPAACVLTPHVGEGARLLGTDSSAVLADLVGSASAIAKKYRAAVLLKSAVSVISDGNVSCLNITGSPALAKGGTGDALCGVAAACLCATDDTVAAARLAALRVGIAGEKGARRYGTRSMLTGEMLSFLR